MGSVDGEVRRSGVRRDKDGSYVSLCCSCVLRSHLEITEKKSTTNTSLAHDRGHRNDGRRQCSCFPYFFSKSFFKADVGSVVGEVRRSGVRRDKDGSYVSFSCSWVLSSHLEITKETTTTISLAQDRGDRNDDRRQSTNKPAKTCDDQFIQLTYFTLFVRAEIM